MFSNVTVGLLFAVGFGTWVYSRMYHSTGGRNRDALIVAGVAGGFAFLLVILLLSVFFHD